MVSILAASWLRFENASSLPKYLLNSQIKMLHKAFVLQDGNSLKPSKQSNIPRDRQDDALT